MHITTVEAVLAAAAITALGGALGSAVTGLMIHRTTSNRDHLVRLWERRVELYQEVLTGVNDYWNQQYTAFSSANSGGPGYDGRFFDDSVYLARMQMFATRVVLESFRLFSDRALVWHRCITEPNREPRIGTNTRARDGWLMLVSDAYDVAQGALLALAEAISDEVQVTPGSKGSHVRSFPRRKRK